MENIIFEIIINFYNAFLMVFFLERYLNLIKSTYSIYLVVCTVTYTVIITYLNSRSYFEGIMGFLVYVLVLFFMAVIFLNGTLKEKLYYSLLENIFMSLSAFSVAKIMAVIAQSTLIDIYTNNSAYRVIGVILVQIIVTLLLFLFYKIKDKSKAQLNDVEQYMILTVLILTNLMYILLNKIEIYSDNSIRTQIFLFFVLISLMAINIIIFYLIQRISKMNGETVEHLKLKQNIIRYENNTKEIYNKYEQMRKMKHDITNSYRMISELIKSNKKEELNNYLNHIQSDIKDTDYLVYTGSIYTDALLSSKFNQIKACGIELLYVIEKFEFSGIDELDICSILGNLLDNALEAVVKLSKEKRKIQLTIRNDEYKMIIKVSNPTQQSINENLETTKEDKEFHGIGIKIVTELANKYGGKFQWEVDNLQFKSGVILFRK